MNNPFATHLPVLLACLRRTEGPILELGSGWFSTILINAFSVGRIARTIETDRNWFESIVPIAACQPLTSHSHQMMLVGDYEAAPLFDHPWSVVMIDNEPPRRRGHDLRRLKGRARLFVAHDSEHPDYGYEPVFSSFRYRYDYKRLFPWTTVVSDDDPLDWLEEALRPLW